MTVTPRNIILNFVSKKGRGTFNRLSVIFLIIFFISGFQIDMIFEFTNH